MLYAVLGAVIVILILVIHGKSKHETDLFKTIHDCEDRLTKTETACQDKLRQAAGDIKQLETKITSLNKRLEPRIGLLKVAGSNLEAIPYMSKIIADYETYGIEALACSLNWGYSIQRSSKVKSIREIREDARQIVEKNKEAQYQLAYLLELYPGLKDVIEMDYRQLPVIPIDDLSERDEIQNYLSKEEYNSLSSAERSQLALERYIESHSKTKWQIGRDYELFIGYQYQCNGAAYVEYTGETLKLEDLGRDLIVHQKDDSVLIVQCKYWSEVKEIHEKHITQLFGTAICYALENGLSPQKVKGVLVTNIHLSSMAKKMAKLLDVDVREGVPMGEFPRIKCNNGVGENGEKTMIYHLPFDQQYDRIKMSHKNDFWAFTAYEAEQAGYRRAMRWFGA